MEKQIESITIDNNQTLPDAAGTIPKLFENPSNVWGKTLKGFSKSSMNFSKKYLEDFSELRFVMKTLQSKIANFS